MEDLSLQSDKTCLLLLLQIMRYVLVSLMFAARIQTLKRTPILKIVTLLVPAVIMKMRVLDVSQATCVMRMVILSQMGERHLPSDKMLLTLWVILENVQYSKSAAEIPISKENIPPKNQVNQMLEIHLLHPKNVMTTRIRGTVACEMINVSTAR